MVIDLFAGPGGLGEGFSAYRNSAGDAPFRIAISVEYEEMAHKTLMLRSFFRQFGGHPPKAYYEYIRGQIDRNDLFAQYPGEAEQARAETMEKPRELGPWADDEEVIFSRLRQLHREHDGPKIVIGGPPCQAYSTVGRARNRGNKAYQVADDKRYFLYEEYAKVLAICKPEVFVLENVEGMLSAKLDGKRIFYDVLASLSNPKVPRKKSGSSRLSYRIYSVVTGGEISALKGEGRDCLVEMHKYGVPQARRRIILLGILDQPGIQRRPSKLVPATGIETRHLNVETTIRDLPRLRSQLSYGDDVNSWRKAVEAGARLVSSEFQKAGLDPAKVEGAAGKALRLSNTGGQFVKSHALYTGPEHLANWLPDKSIGGFVNHETRRHKASDLERYLYYSCYASQHNGLSPNVYDLPERLKPDHKNVQKKDAGKTKRIFADRFKVQPSNKPAFTITSHIKKDGHYYIHYDPSQVRSLTVREAARLQTFPDNYFFEGGQGAQYQQVGNAVPPWLASQIAEIVYKMLE